MKKTVQCGRRQRGVQELDCLSEEVIAQFSMFKVNVLCADAVAPQHDRLIEHEFPHTPIQLGLLTKKGYPYPEQLTYIKKCLFFFFFLI